MEEYLQKLLGDAEKNAGERPERNGINTYGEKTLHAVLKYYFEPDEEKHEIKYQGFFADIKNGNKITEIQTRSLRNLHSKLQVFSAENEVLVVYPVKIKFSKRVYEYKTRWRTTDRIISVHPEKTIQSMSTAERIKILNNFFVEMFGLAEFAKYKNIKFCAVFVEVEKIETGEVTYKKGRRTKTRTDTDSIPRSIFEEVYFTEPDDWFEITGLKLKTDFSLKDYADSAGLADEQAKLVLYLFTKLGILKKSGKRGSYLYSKNFD